MAVKTARKRIVVIDGHIIAQFNQGTGWYTCTRASIGNESDFAVWPACEVSMCKAVALIGDAPLLTSDLAPIEKNGVWYPVDDPRAGVSSHNEALRKLARSL